MRHQLRRFVAGLALAAPLLLSACSDSPTEVSPPSLEPVQPQASVILGCQPTPTAATLLTMINGLLPRSPLRTSLILLVSSLPPKFQDRIKLAVRRLIFPIQDLVFRAYYAGRLSGGTSPTTFDKVLRFSEALYCYVGLTPPTYPATTAGEDIVVGVVFPNSPTTTLVTPTEQAAVQVPQGAAPEATTIVIRKLADEPGPLLTSLDQYPFFYEYSGTTATGAPVTFNANVITGICLKDLLVGVPDGNLRVAHNVAPFQFGDVEILPQPPSVPGINCDDLPNVSFLRSSILEPLTRALLPEPLHATTLLLKTTGVGGTTRNFSPFGIVDITSNPGEFTAVSPTESSEEGGSTVSRTVRVRSDNGTPIANVPVTFSTAEGNGTVVTPQPVLTDANGAASASWMLPAASGVYELNASVPAEDNAPTGNSDPPGGNVSSTPDVAFTPQSLTFTAVVGEFFSDGFEAEETAWTFPGTSFWNISTLKNGAVPIRNAAVPTFVSLAPGDLSNGDLPAPFSGSFALWYGNSSIGNPSTGNYIGTQFNNDPGGTSTTSNAGDALSPTFTIPADAPAAVLRFDTWFEIEGVNPDGFDLMTIWVVEDGPPTFIGRLNPLSAAAGDPEKPFTTTGYNMAPAWQTSAFDLSAFKGSTIQLLFRFQTGDVLYNGFRGWLIDNVRVNADPLPTPLTAGLKMAQPAAGDPSKPWPSRTPPGP